MKEYNRILIPTDGSTHAELAIKNGVSLAKLIEAEVLGLYVKDLMLLSNFPDDSDIIVLNNGLEAEGEAILSVIREEAERAGVKYSERVEEGHPAEVILDVAEEEGCDLIVIGTKGRSGITRLLLGSVAENVVRHAHCPVMVVRSHVDD